MFREPARIAPLMPAHAYRSFVIRSPRDVLVRTACEQAGCKAWQYGWETIVDESTDLGQRQADYIRTQSGRTFTEHRSGALVSVSASWRPPTEPAVTWLTVFEFEPYQRCFEDHQTRPEQYLVRGGDWRGNPRREGRRHTRPGDWVEDMAGHLDGLRTAIERG